MVKSLLSAEHFHDEDAALAFIEARLWPNGPVCPRCGEDKRVGRMEGKTAKRGVCKCYRCRRPFTVTMNTVMESSHIPLHIWLQAIHLLCTSKKGISSNQLHRTLGVTLKSAWFLSHRIREAMKEVRDLFIPPMGGTGHTVEVDSTYVGRKAESKAFLPPAKKQAVLALVQRDGGVRTFHVANVTADTLRPILLRHVHTDTRFMTDEAPVYANMGWRFAQHGTVRHSIDEYVRGDLHTNSVEGYFSILKRGVYGVYQHVSEAHLRRYLAEFDFRYTNRVARGVDDIARADLALKGIKGKRLTYRTTRGSRERMASSNRLAT